MLCHIKMPWQHYFLLLYSYKCPYEERRHKKSSNRRNCIWIWLCHSINRLYLFFVLDFVASEKGIVVFDFVTTGEVPSRSGLCYRLRAKWDDEFDFGWTCLVCDRRLSVLGKVIHWRCTMPRTGGRPPRRPTPRVAGQVNDHSLFHL